MIAENKVTDQEETKRNKAKQLRYRKAIAKDVNLDKIMEDLNDISCECDNVRYYFETDDDTLLNALDGDEDEEYEFKMMFADLCAECEQMQEDLEDAYVPECFDTLFAACDGQGDLIGWDSYEGDYFGLGNSYESMLAREEAKKHLCRLTKNDLLDAAQACFGIFRAYIGIMHRYDCLKAAMDILRDENTGFLEAIREIEKAYEATQKDGFYAAWDDATRHFDDLVSCMPAIAWLQ